MIFHEDHHSVQNGQNNLQTTIIPEKYRIWHNIKPGEIILELAARTRKNASTCDFTSVNDVQDEVLRTRFVCSIGIEAVLIVPFKVMDEELDFKKTIAMTMET